jgi:hypothetical protein
MGVTEMPAEVTPFASVGGRPEGVRSGRCIGTYLHNALRCDAVLRLLGLQGDTREEPYDSLASWFSSNADLRLFEELYL